MSIVLDLDWTESGLQRILLVLDWVRCQAKFLTSVKFLTLSGILRDKSSELSDLGEISDQFLHVSYFAPRSEGTYVGDLFFMSVAKIIIFC